MEINANACMYEPATGRFLTADPYVQAPDYNQNYNRYSYCWNNPLKYTNPSGCNYIDPNGNFIEPGNRYRMGVLYVGYGNYRAGYNSERNIRGPIQNGFHNIFNYPHFEELDISDRFYFGYYSSNPYTLW